MDYYRQPQTVAHGGQAQQQNYMYQTASAPSNSGMYYQTMTGYQQQGSPYSMQPSASHGSAMVNQSNVGAVSARRGVRPTEGGAPVIHHAPIHRTDDMPLRMVVDAKYVGAIIGQQGNKIREITKESKARCIVDAQKGYRDAQGSVEKCISISGSPESASKAVMKILEVVEAEREREREKEKEAGGDIAADKESSDKSNEVELKLRAHNQLVGRLIGKQGSTIKKIMAETETTIFVSNSESPGAQAALSAISPMYAELLGAERTITIRAATVSAVSAAEQRVSTKLRQSYENDIANRMYIASGSALPFMAPTTYDTAALANSIRPQNVTSFKNAKMYVPNSVVGAIIGSRGTYIRTIMRNSGAHVHVDGDKKEKNETETEDAEAAKNSVASELEKSSCDEKKEASEEGEKKVKEEEERRVTISGADSQIYRAQYFVFAKVAEQSGQFMDEQQLKLRTEVSVPSRLVGRIIGKGGQNVRELQRLTGAHVKIAEEGSESEEGGESAIQSSRKETEDGGETTVRITGTMHATLAVEARIAALIHEYSRSNNHNDRPNGSSSAGPAASSAE